MLHLSIAWGMQYYSQRINPILLFLNEDNGEEKQNKTKQRKEQKTKQNKTKTNKAKNKNKNKQTNKNPLTSPYFLNAQLSIVHHPYIFAS